MAGVLYVVATPIGNLADLSPRAAEILGQVAAVVAEDTRRSGTLLRGRSDRARLISLPGEQEERRIPLILEQLRIGDVALVSDAGTPAISDPGRRLVAAAREAGFAVVAVPGPSAHAAAVSASGLRADRFLFLGFLPRTKSRSQKLLRASESWALVFHESPHRLAATLEWASEVIGERRVAVAREISKLHETWYLGTAAELAARFRAEPPRGECTIVIEAPPSKKVRLGG
ncbi:MAG TPA: 16S rRNA (cytidine(1402)-2'-O)-methyltransferase [Candidatus Dormibacteraeota bacterium]|nr:16S rRNA (cytidine(1402)-2'-O)-methyltransferase [Candidatus Dormibacteraeota bacterium]